MSKVETKKTIEESLKNEMSKIYKTIQSCKTHEQFMVAYDMVDEFEKRSENWSNKKKKELGDYYKKIKDFSMNQKIKISTKFLTIIQ